TIFSGSLLLRLLNADVSILHEHLLGSAQFSEPSEDKMEKVARRERRSLWDIAGKPGERDNRNWITNTRCKNSGPTCRNHPPRSPDSLDESLAWGCDRTSGFHRERLLVLIVELG